MKLVQAGLDFLAGKRVSKLKRKRDNYKEV